MDKKSINELRRRLKKDQCSFTKVCGCYIDDQKNNVTRFHENFLNLEDEEYFKYLEIAGGRIVVFVCAAGGIGEKGMYFARGGSLCDIAAAGRAPSYVFLARYNSS